MLTSFLGKSDKFTVVHRFPVAPTAAEAEVAPRSHAKSIPFLMGSAFLSARGSGGERSGGAGTDCSCVQDISVTLCEENIMFWEVSGIGTEVIELLRNLPFLEYPTLFFILSRVISFLHCTLLATLVFCLLFSASCFLSLVSVSCFCTEGLDQMR